MNKLQLCPIIWVLILGLLTCFVFKVVGTENMFGFGGEPVAPAGGGNQALPLSHIGGNGSSSGGAVILSSGGRTPPIQLPPAAAAATAAAAAAGQAAARGIVAAAAPPSPSPVPVPPPGPPGAAAAKVKAVLSSPAFLFFSWTCLLSAGAGLALLHRITTCDPGFVRRGGWDAGSFGKRTGSGTVGAGGGGGGKGGKGKDGGGGGGGNGGGGDGHQHGSFGSLTAAAGRGGGGIGSSSIENRGGGGGGGQHGATTVAETLPLLRTDSDNVASGHALLDCPALWAGQWGQICVSCRIVRPLRAKHCAVTDRCIEVFDHYCPWVGNAIGKRNRHTFLVFLWLELYALLSSLACAVVAARAYVTAGFWSDRLAWIIGFVIVDAFVAISVAVLAVAQASQVARNVTTNELANWHRCVSFGGGWVGGWMAGGRCCCMRVFIQPSHPFLAPTPPPTQTQTFRYKYLQDAAGRFHNPFSRTCCRNCHESFHPDEVPMAPAMMPRDPDSIAQLGLIPPPRV